MKFIIECQWIDTITGRRLVTVEHGDSVPLTPSHIMVHDFLPAVEVVDVLFDLKEKHYVLTAERSWAWQQEDFDRYTRALTALGVKFTVESI